jgi:hypothetical protein
MEQPESVIKSEIRGKFLKGFNKSRLKANRLKAEGKQGIRLKAVTEGRR